MSSNNVGHLVNHDDILKALNTYVGKKDVSVQKIQVSKGTDEIEGFTSIILRVSVEFSHNGKIKTKNFIVKRMPQVEVQLKLVEESGVFSKEVYYYQVVVPKLKKFLTSPFPLASCYFAQSDGVNDLLILDDLKSLGFKTMGMLTNLSVDHCKLVMKELPKLHVTSIALEKEVGEKLTNIFPIYEKDPLFQTSMFKPMFAESTNVIIALCEDIPKFQNVSSVLREKLSTVWDQFCEILKPRSDQPNVLCHGDCALHNMMFLHDKNDQPCDVRLIDLQVIRYASPFTDILYFLYLSTTKEIRDENLDEFLHTYMSSYNIYAQECGIAIEPLQFDQVKKYYNSVRAYGVLVYSAIRPMVRLRDELLPKNHDEVEKFDNMFYGERTSAAKTKYAKDENFRKEITAIITELCELYGIEQ